MRLVNVNKYPAPVTNNLKLAVEHFHRGGIFSHILTLSLNEIEKEVLLNVSCKIYKELPRFKISNK